MGLGQRLVSSPPAKEYQAERLQAPLRGSQTSAKALAGCWAFGAWSGARELVGSADQTATCFAWG